MTGKTEHSSQPIASIPSVLGAIVNGCLLEIDMQTGAVGDPGDRLRALLKWDRTGAPSARDLLRLLRVPQLLLGGIKAARLRPGLTQQVIARFETKPGQIRHAQVRLRLEQPHQLFLYIDEFTRQRQEDISRAVMDTALQQGSNELYVTDSRHRLVNINRAALANIGYERDEVLNQPIHHIAPRVADPAFIAGFNDLFVLSKTNRHRYAHRRKDGSEYIFDFATTEVRMFGQHWYVSIGQDITESLAQQDALRESEERLATAIHSGRVAICEFRRDRNRMVVSDSLWDWVGEAMYEPTDDADKWALRRVHPADRQELIRQIEQAASKQNRLDVEFRARHRLGHYIWLQLNATAAARDGVLEQVTGILTNVTAQHLAEAARDRVTHNLQAVLASVSEAILTLDGRGHLIEWNPAAVALLGDRLSLKRAASELFDDPLPLRQSAPVATLHTRIQGETDPECGYVEVRLSPMDLDPEPGYALVILDSSARVLQEQALRAAAAEASAIAQAKSEFLATMSHEIRTPMNGVIGMAQVLMGTDLNAQQQDALRIMVGSGTALLEVINAILDFSRLDAKSVIFEKQPFNLNELCRDVCQLLKQSAAAKQLSLSFHPLPASAQRRIGDANRVRQILLNLAGNAVKFTDEGQISIRVTAEDDSPTVLFEVADTGIGIAEGTMPKLFYAFSQADASTTRRFGGSGLGLAISQQIAQQMGGGLTVQSRLGVGSTFSCQLQLPEADAAAAVAERRTVGAAAFSGARILVVEDNIINQKVAERLLTKIGCVVTIASDGLEALTRWEQQTFDLILMDCQMPRLDGYDATRRIREAELSRSRQQTPIVAMTANVLEADRQACFAAGMNDHAPKPIVLTELQETLSRWLDTPSS